MFSTAKVIDKPVAAKKKAKEELEIPGIEQLAKLDALIKAATSMKATLEAEVKEAGLEHFLSLIGGTRATSVLGVDGVATCSVEFRKRATTSALTDDEVASLRLWKIEPELRQIQQKLFAINPVYAEDMKLLEKVEKALKSIVPEDFIVMQAGISKPVVSDEMFDAAYRNKSAKTAVQIMTVMALKPKLTADYDMDKLIADATAIMQPPKKKVPLPGKKAA